MLERDFQKSLKKQLKALFPGCYVIKIDPTYIQGMPDLLILYKDKWAALEVKRSASASHRPNQEFRVNKLNAMSFAAFIYPENREEIINELCRTFCVQRSQ